MPFTGFGSATFRPRKKAFNNDLIRVAVRLIKDSKITPTSLALLKINPFRFPNRR